MGSGQWQVGRGEWAVASKKGLSDSFAVYLVFVFRVRVLLGVTVSIRDELCLGLWLGVWLESRIGFGINSWA